MADHVEAPPLITLDYLQTNLNRKFPKRVKAYVQIVNLLRSYFKSLPHNKHNLQVLDLGAGLGDLSQLIYDLGEEIPQKLKVIAVENSIDMLDKLDERFEGQNTVVVHENNLREEGCLEPHRLVVPCQSDVIVSMLLTSFVGQTYIQNLFQEVYDNLNTGGAFVLVDEMPTLLNKLNSIIRDANPSNNLNEIYTEEHGYQGTQVVLPIEMYLQTLQAVGFRQIETFYNNNKLRGLLCLK